MDEDEVPPEKTEAGEADPLMDVMRRHRSQLMEHFDSLVLIATKMEQGGSCAYHIGGGCIYAQRGVVRDWLLQEEAGTKETAKMFFRGIEGDE